MGLEKQVPLLAFIIAIVIVLPPVLFLLVASFDKSGPGSPIVFTLNNYVQVITAPFTRTLLFNSFAYSIGSALLSTAVGFSLGFIIHRTDAPFRRVVGYMPLVSLALPFFGADIGWVDLLEPRSGIVNYWFRTLTGLKFQLFNIYSIWGMIWAMGISLSTLSYFIISPSLTNIDSQLEEASGMSGAGFRATLTKIILPLVSPAIISAFFLSFIISMGTIDMPLILGVPAGFWVFTSAINRAINGIIPPEYGLATAYSTILIAIMIFALYLYLRTIRVANKFATISGRSAPAKRLILKRWRWPAAFMLLVYLIVYPVPVISTLVLVSFHNFYNPSTIFKDFSLHNYSAFVSNPAILRSVPDSVIVSLTTMVGAVGLAFLICYTSARAGRALGRLTDFIASLPLAIPSLVLAVGFIWIAVYLPFGLYGSVWILALALIVSLLPLTTRFMTGPMLQFRNELEEASKVSGASWIYTIRRITVPLMRPAILASSIFVILTSLKDIGAALILVTPHNVVLSYEIYQIWTDPTAPLPAIAGDVLLMAVLVMILIIAEVVFGLKVAELLAVGRKQSVETDSSPKEKTTFWRRINASRI